eukprot:1657013-Pyramimonas_sp.AAC.1
MRGPTTALPRMRVGHNHRPRCQRQARARHRHPWAARQEEAERWTTAKAARTTPGKGPRG